MLSAEGQLLLGDNLLAWLVLALGGAMFAGNILAVLRPPPGGTRKEGELERAPRARSMIMAGLGLVAALWALATLVTS